MLVQSCLVTLYFRCSQANMMLLLYDSHFLTSQTKPNWNKKCLTFPKALSEMLNLNLLCDIVFSWLSGQCDILSFKVVTFNWIITPGNQASQITPTWNIKPLISSQNLLKHFSLKLLCDIIFLPLLCQCDISCFTMANFQSHKYLQN